MRLGSTPIHTFTFPFSMQQIKELKITYSQDKRVVLEKHLKDCTIGEKSVAVKLSQSDTFLFAEGINVEIQVRALTMADDALVSGIRVVTADRCLDREVLR